MTPAIEVRDLVRRFGDVVAVDGMSFTVDQGERFGFLGPNGAGKTTVIRILATLLRPTSGEARVIGLDVVRQPSAVREAVGFAMQSVALDDLSTGRENLELIGRLRRIPSGDLWPRIDELLEMMGLTAAADRKAGTYSGGMRRRLDLATALLHRPQVLFLDEPTEGLDPASRTALWDELRRICDAGTTMFLTTHYMHEADELCDRVAIVDAGRIVVEGAPAELKRALGGDVVRLTLEARDPEALVAGRKAVEGRLEGFEPLVRLEPSEDGVTLYVTDAAASIPALVHRLDGTGPRVTALATAQPTLDDVFLHHTGRRIREEEADQPMSLGWW